MKTEIINFLRNNETKIVLIFGFILIAGLSFEAGLLQGKKAENQSIVIENASQEAKNELGATPIQQSVNQSISAQNTLQKASLAPSQNCTYVGSKNSNKYHLPTCRWAKQIKPENIVCFKDAEDAAAKNYIPDKNCIK